MISIFYKQKTNRPISDFCLLTPIISLHWKLCLFVGHISVLKWVADLFEHIFDQWIFWKFDQSKYFHTLNICSAIDDKLHGSSPTLWLILAQLMMTISPSS